jgi:hypothetical protein
MAQLMQRPPARGLPEERLGAPVAQPTPAGLRAAIDGRRSSSGYWAPIGQEQWPTGAGADQPRQQPGCTGLEVQPVGVAALGADPHPLVLQLQVSTLIAKASLARAAVS